MFLISFNLTRKWSADGVGESPPPTPPAVKLLTCLCTARAHLTGRRALPCLRCRPRRAHRVVSPLTPGPHRNRQRCAGPVGDRPSKSRPGPARSVPPKPPSALLEAVLTQRNGPGRVRTVTNRAGTALTGAVRTGRNRSVGQPAAAAAPTNGSAAHWRTRPAQRGGQKRLKWSNSRSCRSIHLMQTDSDKMALSHVA